MLKKVRIDKWLWSVRIFKSRTLAADACRSGKVKIDGKSVKPSFLIEREAEVIVFKGGFNLHFKVIDLIQKRVSAPLAQQCYVNLTSEEEMNKYKDWFIGKRNSEHREKGAGRPTKKERREIDEFKDDIFFDF
jgi:ribosome-associated heat shock protein Hsp15